MAAELNANWRRWRPSHCLKTSETRGGETAGGEQNSVGTVAVVAVSVITFASDAAFSGVAESQTAQQRWSEMLISDGNSDRKL